MEAQANSPSSDTTLAVDIALARRDLQDVKSAINDLSQEQQRLLRLQGEVHQLKDELDNLKRQSGLMSPSLLTRSFSVWGHVFVAQVIIVVGIGVIVFLVTLLETVPR